MSLLPAADFLPPPQTKKVEQVDDYHGIKVADPYRWLEDDVRESKEVAEWVAAENKVTNAFLEKIPQRGEVQKRLTELWNYERYSAPSKEGGKYIYFKNDGLQNQAVCYIQDTLKSPAKVLFDPNTWSTDGTIALAGLQFTQPGFRQSVTRLRAGHASTGPIHRGVHEVSDPSLIAGADTVTGADGIAAGLSA